MAARRKRKTSKLKRISFKPGTSKRKKRRQASRIGPSLIRILKILAVACIFVCAAACILVGIVVGFSFLERYVRETSVVSDKAFRLELANVPDWVTDQLEEKVYVAARGDGNDLSLVQQNIAREVVWLDEVKVQTTHDGLHIEGRWRRPVGLVKSGPRQFYVDDKQVVLDFVAMPHLPIVEITGLSLIIKTPPLGEILERDDLAAAITLLDRLDRRDKIEVSQKPLLSEIDRIDVSNFNGREIGRAHV